MTLLINYCGSGVGTGQGTELAQWEGLCEGHTYRLTMYLFV